MVLKFIFLPLLALPLLPLGSLALALLGGLLFAVFLAGLFGFDVLPPLKVGGEVGCVLGPRLHLLHLPGPQLGEEDCRESLVGRANGRVVQGSVHLTKHEVCHPCELLRYLGRAYGGKSSLLHNWPVWVSENL